MKISTILDQIDLGSIALPEFQRGYVWNRDQVRGLMHSLYRKHPVGSLLVWVTQTEHADARGNGPISPGWVQLLLDGQQRITSLYGIVRGQPPKFFDGNRQAFSGLHFNVEEETFEFYAPMKMKDNPLWIEVNRVIGKGIGPYMQQFSTIPDIDQDKLTEYVNRLLAVCAIKDIDLHIEQVTGEDKTVDVVVDIFNRVNSGGTKLSKGDLALAKICAQWPEARDEMKTRLSKWSKAGYYFRLEWLLRNINTILTGEALFSALKDIDTPQFKSGLVQAEKAVDSLLNMTAGRLGLDHDRVLGSRYSFPLLARYMVQRGGTLTDQRERDALLYWYVHTFLWGRYAGSTESILNQDLALIEEADGALDRLINQLRQNRGDLRIKADDFKGWSLGARFYPLLYMLTRVQGARDWGTGLPLSANMLGNFSTLHLHHICPKALLYRCNYSRPEVNAIANFCFLTQESNIKIQDRAPEEYLPEIERKFPGALASQWIPTDPDLWRVERHRDFLAARRELLANASNDFLDSLLSGSRPEQVQAQSVSLFDRESLAIPGGVTGEEEERILFECLDWVVEQGLPEGELSYELTDPNTGELLAVIDLAWPNGLQEGFSDPVALLIDEDLQVEQIVNQAGYLFFTNMDSFKAYVKQSILAEALA